LSKRIYEQMNLARKLAERDIPIIVSIWSAPDWAIDKNTRPAKGVFLDKSKINSICESIVKYLLYLKSKYGIEVELFSFNEPDYGVEVYQTPEDHAYFINKLGQAFKKNGLNTKLLLGDTGSATTEHNKIVWPAIKDTCMHQYIGAIAFHTYHGCTDIDLKMWKYSADAVNVPLMITEGGTNSAAHRYPQIFLQPWFQFEEIETYLRICAICQPSTIMEWQLTADYSVLVGEGLYNDKGPLRPTQRFWNLKQLGYTSVGSFWLPTQTDNSNVICAAAVNLTTNKHSIHVLNKGAKRKVVIKGLTDKVKQLDVYITNQQNGMRKVSTLEVKNGELSFDALEQSFYSLFNY